jgi:hypothetical protein
VGVIVRVPVSDVDKGRGDARNILVVIEVNIKLYMVMKSFIFYYL